MINESKYLSLKSPFIPLFQRGNAWHFRVNDGGKYEIIITEKNSIDKLRKIK